jgi:hypothetical protein
MDTVSLRRRDLYDLCTLLIVFAVHRIVTSSSWDAAIIYQGCGVAGNKDCLCRGNGWATGEREKD